MRDRAVVARKAHNLEVGGANPSPASKNFKLFKDMKNIFNNIEVIEREEERKSSALILLP